MCLRNILKNLWERVIWINQLTQVKIFGKKSSTFRLFLSFFEIFLGSSSTWATLGLFWATLSSFWGSLSPQLSSQIFGVPKRAQRSSKKSQKEPKLGLFWDFFGIYGCSSWALFEQKFLLGQVHHVCYLTWKNKLEMRFTHILTDTKFVLKAFRAFWEHFCICTSS